MEQNMNQTMNQNPAAGERTFSQDDVNRIVGERLATEKRKQDAAFAEREQELARREALYDLRDQLKDMGLPDELLPVLNVQDKEALKKALEALKKHIDDQATAKQEYKVYQPNLLRTGTAPEAESPDRKLREAMHLPS